MENIGNKEQTDRTKKKPNILPFLALLAFILVGAVFLAIRYYDGRVERPLSDSSERLEITIEEGSSVDQILGKLQEEELLTKTDVKFVKLYLRINDLGGTIHAGNFSIPRNLNIKELITTLQSGQIESVWVVFPEGMRVDEYAAKLDIVFSEREDSSFNADVFMALTQDVAFISTLGLPEGITNLEGYLFPDKYLLDVTMTEEEMIRTFVDNYLSKVRNATYEDMIIASLIEREGRNQTEKKMISDIIRRRLNEGWFLNIDATLLYHHNDWAHVLTVDDLKLDHDYNTYVRLGLTPTPICNPGLVSINASLEPTPNQYYYYIHDPDGNIHYAVSWEEHAQNVNTYLR